MFVIPCLVLILVADIQTVALQSVDGGSVELPSVLSGVDQVVELPGNLLAIRNSDWNALSRQLVLVLTREGTISAQIGSPGSLPGQYYALSGIDFSPATQRLYVTDARGRLMLFRLDGAFERSLLLQKPLFQSTLCGYLRR